VLVTATKLVMDKAIDAINKVQVLSCAQKLGIPENCLNVNGGAISIDHP
jgi:acetyl-CoA acetyltransferase